MAEKLPSRSVRRFVQRFLRLHRNSEVKTMKLVVLDGNSIVNRAFFGVRPLNASDGTPTNAVFGFINILRRILKAFVDAAR